MYIQHNICKFSDKKGANPKMYHHAYMGTLRHTIIKANIYDIVDSNDLAVGLSYTQMILIGELFSGNYSASTVDANISAIKIFNADHQLHGLHGESSIDNVIITKPLAHKLFLCKNDSIIIARYANYMSYIRNSAIILGNEQYNLNLQYITVQVLGFDTLIDYDNDMCKYSIGLSDMIVTYFKYNTLMIVNEVSRSAVKNVAIHEILDDLPGYGITMSPKLAMIMKVSIGDKLKLFKN